MVWKSDSHIVFCPKYRYRLLRGIVNDLVESDIRLLCEWKDFDIEELSVQADHIRTVVKGKLAIKLLKSYPQLKKKPYWGNHFWSPGYFVNTVGSTRT